MANTFGKYDDYHDYGSKVVRTIQDFLTNRYRYARRTKRMLEAARDYCQANREKTILIWVGIASDGDYMLRFLEDLVMGKRRGDLSVRLVNSNRIYFVPIYEHDRIRGIHFDIIFEDHAVLDAALRKVIADRNARLSAMGAGWSYAILHGGAQDYSLWLPEGGSKYE